VTSAHADGRPSDARPGRLWIALALALVYMVAEVVGGLAANSLALLADAGHMLTDVAALGLSVFALWAARRPATARKTYGNRRVEILAALANGATLLVLSVLIVIEAYRRWRQPSAVNGGLMLAVAFGGLAVNLASLAVLRGGSRESLNVRGAWLHVATDTLGSVQAIVAAALIRWLGWSWADPVASVLIAALVVISAGSLVKESLDVLMEAVPKGLDLADVERVIAHVDGVAAVHDLHVWTITSGFVALSAHVTVAPGYAGDVLWRVRAALKERFGITHSTIQVERRPAPQAIQARPDGR